MKTFKCHKEVLAKPMTRQEYNDYRGWELPADENGSDEGYLVEYTDSPNSNHPDHKGYISWSPKDVFEAGYSDVSDYKSRLVLEEKDLSEKVSKLLSFIKDLGTAFSNLDKDEQRSLKEQLQYMSNYLCILRVRTGNTDLVECLPREKVPYDLVQSILNELTFKFVRVEGTNTTQCWALIDGFTIGTGSSGCLNEEDFNQELGEKYAKERAIQDATNNIWFAEGYARNMYYTI